eukprot:6741475-Pyramimonas_sp.AAC.1
MKRIKWRMAFNGGNLCELSALSSKQEDASEAESDDGVGGGNYLSVLFVRSIFANSCPPSSPIGLKFRFSSSTPLGIQTNQVSLKFGWVWGKLDGRKVSGEALSSRTKEQSRPVHTCLSI